MKNRMMNLMDEYAEVRATEFAEYLDSLGAEFIEGRWYFTENDQQMSGSPIAMYKRYDSWKKQEITDDIRGLLTDPLDIPLMLNIDLTDTTRNIEVLVPRQIAMSLMTVFSNMTLKAVGKVFQKDHATVNHAMKCMADSITCNDEYVMPLMVPLFESLYAKHCKLSSVKRINEIVSLTEIIEMRLNKYAFSSLLISRMNVRPPRILPVEMNAMGAE